MVNLLCANSNLLVLTVSFLTRDGSDFYALPFTFEITTLTCLTRFMHRLCGIHCICLASRRLFVYSLAIHLPLWSAKLIQNIVHFVVPRGITILDKLTYSYLWDESIPCVKGVLNTMLMDMGILSEPIRILNTEVAVIIGLVYLLYHL